MINTKKDVLISSKTPIEIPIVLKETAANAIRFENQTGDFILIVAFDIKMKKTKNKILITKSKVKTKTSDQSFATCCEYKMSVVFIKVI